MPDRQRKREIALAHGINEELTIILTTANLAARMLGPDHPASEALSELQHAAMRAAEISRKSLRGW